MRPIRWGSRGTSPRFCALAVSSGLALVGLTPAASAQDQATLGEISVEGSAGGSASGASAASSAGAGNAGSAGTGPERGDGPVKGFVAKRSLTGTKTDTPLIETPQSISVVTADEIATREALSIGAALD